MNLDEYRIMSEVEDSHWWYRTLRGAVSLVLPRLPPSPRVLDAGCGTGATLHWLSTAVAPSRVDGFDFSSEAARFATAKVLHAEIYVSDITQPEMRCAAYDLVTSLDVISMTGVEAARPGLHKLVAHTASKGFLVLNLPAYQWLYSEHDVAVHTKQRFDSAQVRRLLSELGLREQLVTYRGFFLFPAIVASRLPSIVRRVLGRLPATHEAKSDVARSDGLVNYVLSAVGRVENALIAAGVRFPFGSSVFVIAQKP